MNNKNEREILPSNKEAEKVVIGSMILSDSALYKVLSILNSEDFYLGKHQIIYKALLNLNDKHISVDTITLVDELLLMNELDNIGGVDYLKECTDNVTALATLDFYINIVKDNSDLRKFLSAIRTINQRYYDEKIETISDFIKESETLIKEATEEKRTSTIKTIEMFSKEAVLQIENQKTSGDGYTTGITTGYENINSFTNGFQRGEVTIVGARTSVGKTTLALNMAYKTALRGNPVVIFELEMSGVSLAKKLISIASNVPLSNITTGHLTDIDKMKINKASEELSRLPIYIDECSKNSIRDIETKTRQLLEQHPDIGLVIVDHMSIVKVDSGKKNETRVDEMRKISQQLHMLAKDLNVAILAVAQLNRNSVKGEVTRPRMVDIKESGAIEQDADVILLLYDELYENNKKMSDPKLEDVRHIEVIVAKQRNGRQGIAHLLFLKKYSRYEMPSKDWEDQFNKMNYGQSYL